MKHTFVTVLDDSKQFLEYVHPAFARKLIKEGHARIYSTDPFAVQLVFDVSTKVRKGLIKLDSLV